MAQPYDRKKYYPEPDTFLKIIDEEGNWDYYAIVKDEPLGQHVLQFANGVIAVAAGAFSDPQRVNFDFLEPQRENRLFFARFTIFAVNRTTGVIININTISPLIQLEWGHPTGVVRGGTDRQRTVTLNGIASIVGGPAGGRMPANMIYSRDDPSEVFDVYCTFGRFPDVRIFNGTTVALGAGGGPLDFDWNIGVVGFKYIIRKATEEEGKKLESREWSFRGITLGGIEAVSTRG